MYASCAVSDAKLRGENFLIEPDKVGFTHPDGRCAHITGWAEHSFNRFGADPVTDIKLADLLAFHGNQLAG